MRIPRIYTEQTLAVGHALMLEPEPAHHIARVLRLPVGAALRLFNGDGNEYSGSIAVIDKRQVVVAIDSTANGTRESPLSIYLGIAISKGERMDWVIQKATELGVSAITPLLSERVEVRLQGERAEKKLSHWRGITIAACEQCARNRLPVLEPIRSLHDWLDAVQAERKYVLHHRSAQPLADAQRKPATVALLIGPEGGLSETEINAAERNGFLPLRLGPRVLRTETAPLAALSVLQFLWGDLGDSGN